MRLSWFISEKLRLVPGICSSAAENQLTRDVCSLSVLAGISDILDLKSLKPEFLNTFTWVFKNLSLLQGIFFLRSTYSFFMSCVFSLFPGMLHQGFPPRQANTQLMVAVVAAVPRCLGIQEVLRTLLSPDPPQTSNHSPGLTLPFPQGWQSSAGNAGLDLHLK